MGMLCNTEDRIAEVLVTKRRSSDEVLELIASADGGYRIAVNGEVLGCFYWKKNEYEDCVRTFDRLANRGSGRF